MSAPGASRRAILSLRGRRGDCLVAACAAALLVRSAILAGLATAEAIALLPAEIALGWVPEGDERAVTLTVSNRGAAPADVVVVPSCTCTTAGTGPLRVAAFSNATFTARVSTARRPGYNVTHVQIAAPSGAVLAQSRITFTAVRELVLDPPVLFLRGGDDRVVARAHALGRAVPGALVAAADDPAIAVRTDRVGARVWEVSASLRGRPRAGLSTVRVAEGGRDGAAGTLTVGLPASRVGDIRLSPVAERVGKDRARAWMLFDTEASCGMRVLSLRALGGATPEWRAEPATTSRGSNLWVELVYPGSEAPTIELEVGVGRLRERMTASLPEATGR